jgi:hypothetical protein
MKPESGRMDLRGQRSVQRLQNLRAKIDDILTERPSYEKERILPIIEGALSLLDELKDEPLVPRPSGKASLGGWSFRKWKKPERTIALAGFR